MIKMAKSNVYWRKKQGDGDGEDTDVKQMDGKPEKKKLPPPTLCWQCGNICGGCSWSERFEPVEGWVAIPTKVGHYGLQSFVVLKCPAFRMEFNKKYSHPDQMDSDGAEKLVQAIIRTAADDYRTYPKLRAEVTNFFRGDFFAQLTGVDPEYIISRLKTEVRMKLADKVRV